MQRLGIYRRWPTEDKILKRISVHAGALDSMREADRQQLEDYAKGGNLFEEKLQASGFPRVIIRNYVTQAFSFRGSDLEQATREIFSHQPPSIWEPKLKKYWGYSYWRTRIDQYAQVDETIGMGADFTSAMVSLAECLCVGWMTEAKLLTEEILVLYENKRFYDVGGIFGQPLYHWLLRICFDHWGWEFSEWGNKNDQGGRPAALGQPVLNELVAHWRDSDLAPMQDHILWLCDYYTHRTKPADGYEFGNDWLLQRFPAAIMAWQRLRQERGLANPPIDHPLMQSDYARLREPVPVYTDPLLEAVLERLRREEMPDLGAVRRPVPPAKKPRLLARLFGRS